MCVCVCVCSHTRHLLEVKFHLSHNLGPAERTLGIATRYGLEGPGIESRWGKIFRIYPDRLRGPPILLCNWYRVFPGGKGGRGVMLTAHPLLVARLRKSLAIPPLTPWVLLGLLRGYLYLYLTILGKECRSLSSSLCNFHYKLPSKIVFLLKYTCSEEVFFHIHMIIALKHKPFYEWVLYFRYTKDLTTSENLC